MLSANTAISRRQLLQTSACGFGALAMSDLCSAAAPHYLSRAKRVIFLFMYGGPSQLDTFDYKPRLQAEDGQTLPFEPAPNLAADTSRNQKKLLASPWKFARHGQCGQWVSELLPHTAKHVDDLCLLQGMHSRGQSHGQAVSMLHTGSDQFVRPSMGSWVSYGLGSENRDLPEFVSLAPPSGHGGPRNHGPAFLPAEHQGLAIGRAGKLGDAKVRYLQSETPAGRQQRQLDLLQSFNRQHLRRAEQDAAIEGAIQAMELAFRMQAAAPKVLDLSQEPQHILDLYGVGQADTDNFGRQCLLARRMAEAGVRYIQCSTGYTWDQHFDLKKDHEKNCRETDLPIAGLLTDLKQRGLLEDTLVWWGGEFGRTPIVEGRNGRDHNPQGYTMWLAGGGVQSGVSYGETDEYGYYAVRDRVHIHDLHATILHLLGLDHQRLTYRYAGRDFRLTDVYGRVVKEIFA